MTLCSRAPVRRPTASVTRGPRLSASSLLACSEANPGANFDEEEVFAACDRCVVRWRYDWGAGHVRGVDVIRLRDGRICETLGYVKG